MQQSNKESQKAQDDYILQCEQLLWEIKNYYDFEGHPQSLSLNRQKEVLSQWYHLGKMVYQVLNCAYMDFELAVLTQGSVYPKRPRWSDSRRNTWYNQHGVDFRQKQKYQRQPHHHKKMRDETYQVKQDWRTRKGFQKDHQKNAKYSLGETRFFKTESNRSFRHHAKQKIQQGLFDEIVDILEYSQEWDWYY